ncbi:MAG: chemotaxis-specific protein-glutamate methyltransferase CheB [Pontixanthobacter sp.]
MNHAVALSTRRSGTPRRTAEQRRPIQIMIVDDSLTVRTAFARMIDVEHDIVVAHTTSSAELALRQLDQIDVDVVLLDLEMPGMGGLAALPKLLAAQNNLQICVISSLTGRGAEPTLQALAMGAADTMLKPLPGGFDDDYKKALIEKIRALGRAQPRTSALRRKRDVSLSTTLPPLVKRPEIIAIGASTGGIHATCQMLHALPAKIDMPIVITQHLPPSFMALFAKQLTIAATRPAQVAEHGMTLKSGNIYVAPGNGHLTIKRKDDELVVRITAEICANNCLPSVDPMFASIADATQGGAIGIVMSGMGKDGADGAACLAAHCSPLLVQDRDSAAVWGMPGAVANRGYAAAVLPPVAIARAVVDLLDRTPWK